MAPTAFTSLVMVAFAVVVLTMSCWAWFGDWEPRPPQRQPVEDQVDALRRAIEAYEQEQQRKV